MHQQLDNDSLEVIIPYYYFFTSLDYIFFLVFGVFLVKLKRLGTKKSDTCA